MGRRHQAPTAPIDASNKKDEAPTEMGNPAHACPMLHTKQYLYPIWQSYPHGDENYQVYSFARALAHCLRCHTRRAGHVSQTDPFSCTLSKPTGTSTHRQESASASQEPCCIPEFIKTSVSATTRGSRKTERLLAPSWPSVWYWFLLAAVVYLYRDRQPCFQYLALDVG